MAEDTPTTTAPEADPAVAPAETKPAAEESAPEAPKDKQEANGSEEKPSGKHRCVACSFPARRSRAVAPIPNSGQQAIPTCGAR